MFNLNQIADAVLIPSGMRPYFFETIKAMILLGEDMSVSSLLPMLIRLILYCDIYASPQKLAAQLLKHFLSCVTYHDGPGGLRIPEFRCRGKVNGNDIYAHFLAETVTSFVLMHPQIVKERP